VVMNVLASCPPICPAAWPEQETPPNAHPVSGGPLGGSVGGFPHYLSFFLFTPNTPGPQRVYGFCQSPMKSWPVRFAAAEPGTPRRAVQEDLSPSTIAIREWEPPKTPQPASV